MEDMEVVEEKMDKGEAAEEKGDNTEAEGGGFVGPLLALEATGLLTQDADPGGTTLLDAHNGLNEMSRLAMLWTVRHHWLTGARFSFNCYRHWKKLLFRQPGVEPVILLRRDGVS